MPRYKDGTLKGRHLNSMVNSTENTKIHEELMGSVVRTRFPPEPNGYLHIGHAKSMYINFVAAFEQLEVLPKNRETFLRFDDTNPETESQEYIDSIIESVGLLGYNPTKITYSSDYFDQIYNLTIKLIEKGLAYVCHQNSDEVKQSRVYNRERVLQISSTNEKILCLSPWRDRPVEENLKEFEQMRKGFYKEGKASLRLKIDMNSLNPNMWDPVAWRVKFCYHHRTGDKWCIYPSYDLTHAIVDSLEHIDFSICTLEFETRRESYYWLLDVLDLYKPNVFEFARLNIDGAVMSKRKILEMISDHKNNSSEMISNETVSGWDDPRLYTIKGLFNRGLNSEIINEFCKDTGISTANSSVDPLKLENIACTWLSKNAIKTYGILDPLKVLIKESGTLFYIDKSSFKINPEKDYKGLSVGEAVYLKNFSDDEPSTIVEAIDFNTDDETCR